MYDIFFPKCALAFFRSYCAAAPLDSIYTLGPSLETVETDFLQLLSSVISKPPCVDVTAPDTQSEFQFHGRGAGDPGNVDDADDAGGPYR